MNLDKKPNSNILIKNELFNYPRQLNDHSLIENLINGYDEQ